MNVLVMFRFSNRADNLPQQLAQNIYWQVDNGSLVLIIDYVMQLQT